MSSANDAPAPAVALLKTRRGGGMTVAYLSPAAARLLGVSGKKSAGSALEDVFPSTLAGSVAADIARPFGAGRFTRTHSGGAFPYTMIPLEAGGIALFFSQAPASPGPRSVPPRTITEPPGEFRDVADSLDELIWVADLAAYRVLYVNRAYERIFGRPRDEMVGNPMAWLAYVHPLDMERIRGQTMDIGRSRRDVTYRILLPDSSIKWVHARLFPVCDDAGRPIRLIGIEEDVTERVRITGELEASEKRFRGLFSESPASLWAVDLSGVKIMLDGMSLSGVRDLAARLREHPADRKEALALIHVSDVSRATVSLFKAEDRKQILSAPSRIMTEEGSLALMDALAALHGGDELAESVSRWRTFTGEDIDLVMRLTIAPGSETSWREVLLSFTDITDLKAKERALSESEEKFRIVSEQSQIGLGIVQDNRVVYANRAFAQFTGFEEGTVMRAGLMEAGRMFPGETMLGAMRQMDSPEGAIRMADVPLTTVIGERKWFNVFLTRVSIEGKPAGMAALVDITEEKRAREQARERQAQLIQADKLASIGVLAAGVAHEINNPNQAIILSSQVLMDAWADVTRIMDEYSQTNGDFSLAGVSYSQMREMMKNCVSAIRDCSAKIETIVSDLKGFARQDVSESFRPLDLNMAVKSSLTLLTNMLKKSTQKLSVNLAGHLPPVMGNYQRLEQVFINLIQNACQALPDASRGISISTFFEEASSRVVFQVDDEGTGIKVEDMPHITDPFFTTKRESGGTGLGLSICATIVDQHAGSMTHEPRPEGGTRAMIRLPAV